MTESSPVDTVQTLHLKIQNWLTETFPVARQNKPEVDDALLDGGIIDSMGTLEVVQYLEDEFGIEVDDEDMVADHFNSIRAIADYIQTKS